MSETIRELISEEDVAAKVKKSEHRLQKIMKVKRFI